MDSIEDLFQKFINLDSLGKVKELGKMITEDEKKRKLVRSFFKNRIFENHMKNIPFYNNLIDLCDLETEKLNFDFSKDPSADFVTKFQMNSSKIIERILREDNLDDFKEFYGSLKNLMSASSKNAEKQTEPDELEFCGIFTNRHYSVSGMFPVFELILFFGSQECFKWFVSQKDKRFLKREFRCDSLSQSYSNILFRCEAKGITNLRNKMDEIVQAHNNSLFRNLLENFSQKDENCKVLDKRIEEKDLIELAESDNGRLIHSFFKYSNPEALKIFFEIFEKCHIDTRMRRLNAVHCSRKIEQLFGVPDTKIEFNIGVRNIVDVCEHFDMLRFMIASEKFKIEIEHDAKEIAFQILSYSEWNEFKKWNLNDFVYQDDDSDCF